MTQSITKSSSFASTSALTAAIKSYKVVWITSERGLSSSNASAESIDIGMMWAPPLLRATTSISLPEAVLSDTADDWVIC
jgi:hypothetical protein